jgi:hypothetical protein
MAAAAFGGRVIISSLLADFAVCASQGRNSGSTGTKSTRGDAQWPVETVAASGWCISSPLWMIIPKIEFSLFVVFFLLRCKTFAKQQAPERQGLVRLRYHQRQICCILH